MWLHWLDEKVEHRGTQLTPHRARLRGSVRFHAVGASLGVRPSTSRRNLRRKKIPKIFAVKKMSLIFASLQFSGTDSL
jgi:hypothetical protein